MKTSEVEKKWIRNEIISLQPICNSKFVNKRFFITHLSVSIQTVFGLIILKIDLSLHFFYKLRDLTYANLNKALVKFQHCYRKTHIVFYKFVAESTRTRSNSNSINPESMEKASKICLEKINNVSGNN